MNDDADPPPDSRGARPTPGPTSPSLIDGVKRRDPECERRLLYLYEPLVLRRCRARVRDRDDAMDITQEVFATAFVRIADFTLPTAGGGTPRPGFRPWLYAILRHKIGDYIRRRAHRPAALGGSDAHEALHQVPDDAEPPSSGPGGPPPDDPSDEALVARRAMELVRAEFEDRTWRAAFGVIVEGRKAPEVAAELGMRPGNVHVAKSRVLKRLRAVLAEFGESPDPPGDPP